MASSGRAKSESPQSRSDEDSRDVGAVVVRKERRSLQVDSNSENSLECNLTTSVATLFGWEPHQQVEVTLLKYPEEGRNTVEIEAIEP